MRVLVTGANGFVGSHVVRRLLRDGCVVRCLVRREGVPESLKDLPVDLCVGHLGDPSSLRRAVDGVETVFHLAASLTARSRREMLRTNAAGTRNLVDAVLATGGVTRFVHCSSIAAAGPSAPGRPHVEGADGRPVTWYGESKALSERVVRGVLLDRVPWTIVRPPLVFGPRDRGLLSLFSAVARGIEPHLAGGSREYSWVFGPDLADAFVVLGRHPAAAGGTYYATGGDIATLSRFLALTAKAVGRRTLRVRLPDSLVRLVAAASDVVTQAMRSPAMLTRDKAHEVVAAAWTCAPDAAARDAGWRAPTPLADGIAETVGWYRSNGWV